MYEPYSTDNKFDGVIFDTMEAPGLAIAPFLRGIWGSEAMRLLNVAVTRARHKLVLIAHRDHLRTLPRTMLLPQLIDLAAQKHGCQKYHNFATPDS